MDEQEIIKFVDANPGCSIMYMRSVIGRLVNVYIDEMVKDRKLILICENSVTGCYTPAQIERKEELALGYETQ